MKSVTQTTVFITGTSSGFGKLIALALAEAEYRVIAGMRDLKRKNAAAAALLSKTNGIIPVEIDVTSSRSVNAAVNTALVKYGKIDVLICNAGISALSIFEATSVGAMKKIFDVNLWGSIRCIQAVLPAMREKRAGLIITISSVAELFPIPYLAAYSGSKCALGGMSESIRDEVSGFGIEVINVQPGPFPTGIGAKNNRVQSSRKISDAYAQNGFDRSAEISGAFENGIAKHQAANEEVVNAVRKLLDLKPGSRPLQVFVNRMAGGIEQHLVDIKQERRPEWLKRMGFSAV